MRATPLSSMLTPPEVAKRLRIKPERVIAMIRSGRLRGINVSQPGSRRPRFRVSPEALDEFERLLQVSPPSPRPPRRRKPEGVIAFF